MAHKDEIVQIKLLVVQIYTSLFSSLKYHKVLEDQRYLKINIYHLFEKMKVNFSQVLNFEPNLSIQPYLDFLENSSIDLNWIVN